jgi:hypothetical protein
VSKKKTTISDLISQQMQKVPTNVKLFGQYLVGDTSDITEKDFKPAELEVMRKKIQQQDAQNMEDESAIIKRKKFYERKLKKKPIEDMYSVTEDGLTAYRTQEEHDEYYKGLIDEQEEKLSTYNIDRNKTSVGYGRDNLGGGEGAPLLESIANSFKSPQYNVETSLGHFNAHKNKDGTITIKDKYDFLGLGYGAERKISMKNFMLSLAEVRNPEQLGTLLSRKFLPSRKRNVEIKLPSLLKNNNQESKQKKKKSLISPDN